MHYGVVQKDVVQYQPLISGTADGHMAYSRRNRNRTGACDDVVGDMVPVYYVCNTTILP